MFLSLPRPPQPAWQPLGAIDRRVLGVLAEKAKTTPDGYPMSLNAICTGCNQKSNRDPVMQLELDDVQESLDRLRQLGAVGMVEGYGRVTKYRHYLYEWLGVEKIELSVMTELLLRGAQTEGELRGRASRMDAIPDLAGLRALLASLKAKKLVIPLTPEGRGHVVDARAVQASRDRAPSDAIRPRPGALRFRPTMRRRRPGVPLADKQPASAAAPVGRAADSARGEIDELRGATGRVAEPGPGPLGPATAVRRGTAGPERFPRRLTAVDLGSRPSSATCAVPALTPAARGECDFPFSMVRDRIIAGVAGPLFFKLLILGEAADGYAHS